MAGNNDSYPTLGSVCKAPGSKVNQLSLVNLDSKQAVHSNKLNLWQPQNKPGSSSDNPWGNPNVIQKLGKSGDGQSGTTPNGKTWQTKNANPKNQVNKETMAFPPYIDDEDDMYEDDSDLTVYGSDDDLYFNESETDEGEKSHEEWRKNMWFRKFFDKLDQVPYESINSQAIKWHCPACQGGPGAIDWYKGLQPLIHHCKTKMARRVKIHRRFADVLNEELSRKGVFIAASTGVSGRWEALDEKVADHDIVWPPMIVIMNTAYAKDENNKWVGMGNQELLDHFSRYAALKARHAYGPQGHRGVSILIFEASARGYIEDARLHRQFKEKGRDQHAWDNGPTLYAPGGRRQLYGFLAEKKDLEDFNRHAPGKSKMKYEMKSYQENVEKRLNDLSVQGQELERFKKIANEERKQSEGLAQSLSKVSEKLRQAKEENNIVRERAKLQHEEFKEEMNSLESFYCDQVNVIHQALGAKQQNFEHFQQEKLEKMRPSSSDSFEMMNNERDERILMLQQKEMRKFETERVKLEKVHQDKKVSLRNWYLEEEVKLEREFKDKMTKLIQEHIP